MKEHKKKVYAPEGVFVIPCDNIVGFDTCFACRNKVYLPLLLSVKTAMLPDLAGKFGFFPSFVFVFHESEADDGLLPCCLRLFLSACY